MKDVVIGIAAMAARPCYGGLNVLQRLEHTQSLYLVTKTKISDLAHIQSK